MMCQVSCPFSYSPGLQKYAPTGIASVPSLGLCKFLFIICTEDVPGGLGRASASLCPRGKAVSIPGDEGRCFGHTGGWWHLWR